MLANSTRFAANEWPRHSGTALVVAIIGNIARVPAVTSAEVLGLLALSARRSCQEPLDGSAELCIKKLNDWATPLAVCNWNPATFATAVPCVLNTPFLAEHGSLIIPACLHLPYLPQPSNVVQVNVHSSALQPVACRTAWSSLYGYANTVSAAHPAPHIHPDGNSTSGEVLSPDMQLVPIADFAGFPLNRPSQQCCLPCTRPWVMHDQSQRTHIQHDQRDHGKRAHVCTLRHTTVAQTLHVHAMHAGQVGAV
jgi:hypothetical protein